MECQARRVRRRGDRRAKVNRWSAATRPPRAKLGPGIRTCACSRNVTESARSEWRAIPAFVKERQGQRCSKRLRGGERMLSHERVLRRCGRAMILGPSPHITSIHVSVLRRVGSRGPLAGKLERYSNRGARCVISASSSQSSAPRPAETRVRYSRRASTSAPQPEKR